ncbi:MAG: MASE1 domain-containing protein [Flavobacterium sp.]
MGNTLKKTFQNNIITFLLYYLTAVGGIKFISLPPGNLTVIWLPAGIAMGCLLVFGRKVLPAIFLGTFFIQRTFFYT